MARQKTERVERYIPLYLTDEEHEQLKKRTEALRAEFGTNRAHLLRKIFVDIDEKKLIKLLIFLDLLKNKDKVLE